MIIHVIKYKSGQRKQKVAIKFPRIATKGYLDKIWYT